MKKIAALAVALALSACASTGTNVTEQQAAQFTPGVTTKAEVIAALGQPNGMATNTDGTSALATST
jgi:outer membrane protein assembly factor BamE (lipoprotein component of BamABCDE complex)